MATILFSSNEIHFENPQNVGSYAVYIPAQDKVRVFSDISSEKQSVIAERYGAKDHKVLWRGRGGQIVVYGELPTELAERRHELSVHLAEDFVTDESNVLLYVMGDKSLVYGIRQRNDDGQIVWGVSRIDVIEDPVKETVELLSERMLSGEEEKFLIAVSGNNLVYDKLKDMLRPFDLAVQRFETLKPNKLIKPVYRHGSFGWLMLLTLLISILLLVAAGVYWGVNSKERSKKEDLIEQERVKIDRIQLNENIGHIRNPGQFLERMAKTMKRPPSAVLHGAAVAGASMGRLSEIDMYVGEDANIKEVNGEKNILIEVQIPQMSNSYLVDQENLAKTLIAEMPWVRSIKYVGQSVNRLDNAWIQMMVRVE